MHMAKIKPKVKKNRTADKKKAGACRRQGGRWPIEGTKIAQDFFFPLLQKRFCKNSCPITFAAALKKHLREWRNW